MEPFFLAVGAGDGVTGLLLIAVPSWTLGLMRIPTLPDETVYLRWIGVFVGSIGLFYVYPFLSGNRVDRRVRLRIVLEVSTMARIAVAVFVAAGIAAGALGWQWASVSVTDFGVASIQIALLRRGVLVDDPA